MPEKERQDGTLAGLVVKEAVERGMETEFRDQIVEAVDAAEGRKSGRARKAPLAGLFVGLGAAIGYLVGRGDLGATGTHLEDVEPPEVIDEMSEAGEEVAEAVEPEMEAEPEGGGRGRLLATLMLVAGAVAGLEFLRRRRGGEEEWEPIEEFEPATDAAFGDEESEEGETAEAAADEETEEETEEAETEE